MTRGSKVFEWVFWFEDGHVMTKYTPEDPDVNSFERMITEAQKYHEDVSPVVRVGWVPISPQKAAYTNIKARYMEALNKSPLPFHIVECHGMFPYLRLMPDIEYGIQSNKVEKVEYGHYLLGVGGERVEHPQDDGKVLIEYRGGMYLNIDSSGNARLDHTSFVLDPLPVNPEVPIKIPE